MKVRAFGAESLLSFSDEILHVLPIKRMKTHLFTYMYVTVRKYFKPANTVCNSLIRIFCRGQSRRVKKR